LKKSRLILLSSAIAICPAMIPAQTASLEICNNGQKEIDVAVAARIQLFITGYKWKSTGWYAVPARDCAVVYSEDYDEAGPITPQSGARIAYTVVNSEGVWGAYLSGVKNGGWMRSGTGDICVKRGEPFEFTRPAGDPAADCEGMTIPVADEFLPEHAGKYTVTMAWEGDRFFTPLGTGQPAAGNTPQKPPEDSVGMQVLKALAKAAAEEGRKKQEADAAAAESQRQAQAAQEQRQADPPPVAPPAAPPAPATPPPAPPNTPEDDPIGSGGIIAPPATFNALMCVPAAIANDSAWSAPEAGSKMAAFRDVVAQYIVSIAKPGWEYWVIPGQYESFDPASPTSGNQIVSTVSPASGRFDEFDPKCPSGYSGYWVKVSH
jgi:hypothetical protein